MPKRLPKYSHHRATGQARVRIPAVDREQLTIARLAVRFVAHARSYYLKDGIETSEVQFIQLAQRPLVKQFGGEKVSQFGPRKLQRVRDEMIGLGWARTGINAAVQRITRMFRWGCEKELVAPDVYQGCKSVAGLRMGRSAARETEPVKPVPQPDIDAVQPFVSSEVWTMIQFQLATGARPGEACILRTCDIDMSSDVWEYRPRTHKTIHHGRQRVLFIGPRGQNIIRPYLSADRERYLFSPQAAERARSEARRENRQSPMTPSQSARQAKQEPIRTAGRHYRRDSYTRAIARACELAGVER